MSTPTDTQLRAGALAFERYLHAQIPLTRAMAVSVVTLNDEQARLRAKFAPNVNHQCTAFGGSIAALATTVAWAYVHARLQREAPATVVIQRNTVDFIAPAHGDFEAWCGAPAAADWEHFRAVLARKGRARLDMTATVETAGRPIARFTGRYVALRTPNG